MLWLKQSTSVTVKIGPFVDEDDGKTAETGLTISQADVRLSKNGGNMAQKNEATSCTHDEIGVYDCPLDTTDTNTLGRLQLFVHESGALPVWHEFMVVPANVWDSFFGSDMLQVDVHAVDDDETAADNLESACDNYSATRGLAGTALPAAAADAAGGLPISDAGGLDMDAIPTHLTDIKGGTFNGTTDSLEAIRNRGDAAWITGSGGDATAANQTTIINHLTDVKGTGFVKDTDSLVDLAHTGADSDTLETLSDQLDSVQTLGSGAITFTYTLTSSVDSSPIADADVWVTTDQAGTNVVASGQTDSSGQVTFYLDAGTVYVWRQKDGWNFTNPDTETVA